MAVAVPLNVDNGSNVTEPSLLTVYVPWFATLTVVALQLFGDCPLAHSFTVDATKGALASPGVSLERIFKV